MKNYFRLLLSCFCFFFFHITCAQQASNRPNIILIVADDHGTDALGSYGNNIIRTPNLDKLASEGQRFTNAFCTTASCSPSRSVLLTGRHNHDNGMYGLEHSIHHFKSFDSIKSLPVLMKAAGYRTARIGKYHVGPENVFQFETVLSEGAANDPEALGRSSVEMAEQCREYVKRKEAPFFLYFALDDPHRSNLILPTGLPDFDTYPEPNLFGNRKRGYPGVINITYTPENVIVPAFLPDNHATRAELAQYYQAVSRLDQGVGRLLEILKESGQYENSLIIYLSDNGVAFPGAKTTLYDPGMRLPLIVRQPYQNESGKVRDALVSWVDITPTILDYAGLDAGAYNLHGRSFKDILEDENAEGQVEIFASHSLHEITMYYPMRVIRNKRHKLIYNIASELRFPLALDLVQSSAWQSVQQSGSKIYGKRTIKAFLHRPKFELYDIIDDPDETKNLANHPEYKLVFEQLIDKLKKFQKTTNDPWFHKWSYE